MSNEIKIELGASFEIKLKVEHKHTAEAFGSGAVLVFATPCMIAFMEDAAKQAVQPKLEAGCTTVGTKVNIEHVAATPIGSEVVIKAVLKEIDGRRLVFDVEAFDQKEKIGFGTHERFVINIEKFMAKTLLKL